MKENFIEKNIFPPHPSPPQKEKNSAKRTQSNTFKSNILPHSQEVTFLSRGFGVAHLAKEELKTDQAVDLLETTTAN